MSRLPCCLPLPLEAPLLYQKLDTSYLELAEKIAQEQELSEEIESSIKKLIAEVLKEGGYEEHA